MVMGYPLFLSKCYAVMYAFRAIRMHVPGTGINFEGFFPLCQLSKRGLSLEDFSPMPKQSGD